MFHRSRIPTKLRLKPTSEPGLSILLVLMGPSERGASLESSVPLRGKLDCFVQMLGRWSRLAWISHNREDDNEIRALAKPRPGREKRSSERFRNLAGAATLCCPVPFLHSGAVLLF